MVQKAVAGVGSAVIAGGVGLMVAASLMESFVVVVVPNEEGATPEVLCEDPNLGNLGIFTASYNADCTKGSDFYDTFKAVEEIESKPTTEFPLLFSSQQGVPMFVGEDGDPIEFTNCEDFWAVGGAAETAAYGTAVDVATVKIDEALAPIGVIVESIPTQLEAVGPFVTGLWADSALDAATQIAGLAEDLTLPAAPISTILSEITTLDSEYDTTIATVNSVQAGNEATLAAIAAAAPDAVADAATIEFSLTCDCSTPGCQTANGGGNATVCGLTQDGTKVAIQESYITGLLDQLAALTTLDSTAFQSSAVCDCTDPSCQGLTAAITASSTPSEPLCVGFQSAYNFVTTGGEFGKGALNQVKDELSGANLLLTLAGAASIDFSKTIVENNATGIYTLPTDLTASGNDGLCILLALDASQGENRQFLESNAEANLLAFLGQTATCDVEYATVSLAANAATLTNALLGEETVQGLPDSIPLALVDAFVANLLLRISECATGPSNPSNGCVNATVYGVGNTEVPQDLSVYGVPKTFASNEWFHARLFGVESDALYPAATKVLNVIATLFGNETEDARASASGLAAVGGLLQVCNLASITDKDACYAAHKTQGKALIDQTVAGLEVNLQTLNAVVTNQTAAACAVPEVAGAVAQAYAIAQAVSPLPDSNDCATQLGTLQLPSTAQPALSNWALIYAGLLVTLENELEPSLSELYGGLVNAASENVIPGNTSAARVASCEDDNKDKEIFETAQMMVPAAIALAALGMLVSFAAVGTNKKVLGIVGGILAVLGGGVLLGALLNVLLNAPVYKLVSEAGAIEDAEPGSAYYKPGLAQTLAYGGILGPILGGLLVLGSSFCGPSEEESQALSGKVDGTY